ncbi:MAG: transcription factor S [Candidatus Thorarchaeota archaeon]
MSFCDCGALLVPAKQDDGTIIMRCPACGKTIGTDSDNNSDAFEIKQKIRHNSEKEMMVVIDDANAVETMPTAAVSCQKCGHTKAVYWQVQTRSGDEASTTFYRCKKCGFTWRDYG